MTTTTLMPSDWMRTLGRRRAKKEKNYKILKRKSHRIKIDMIDCSITFVSNLLLLLCISLVLLSRPVLLPCCHECRMPEIVWKVGYVPQNQQKLTHWRIVDCGVLFNNRLAIRLTNSSSIRRLQRALVLAEVECERARLQDSGEFENFEENHLPRRLSACHVGSIGQFRWKELLYRLLAFYFGRSYAFIRFHWIFVAHFGFFETTQIFTTLRLYVWMRAQIVRRSSVTQVFPRHFQNYRTTTRFTLDNRKQNWKQKSNLLYWFYNEWRQEHETGDYCKLEAINIKRVVCEVEIECFLHTKLDWSMITNH